MKLDADDCSEPILAGEGGSDCERYLRGLSVVELYQQGASTRSSGRRAHG